jgi:uncharacterized membrane protein
LIKRIFKAGLYSGILIFTLGFANVFDIANPPEILTLLAPYSEELLVLGIIVSSIAGLGLFVTNRHY